MVPAEVGRGSKQNITVNELFSIVIAAAIWGQTWGGKTVRAQCDNMAVVAIVNSGTSREPEVMHQGARGDASGSQRRCI